MYVYIETEHNVGPNGENLYTVGFYDPSGKWVPESDYNDRNEAAARVAYLNGNTNAEGK